MKWCCVLALLISGIGSFLLGRYLHNPKRNESTLYDEKGQAYIMKKNVDTLYWIPMEWWGVILFVLGIVVGIMTLIKH